MHVDSKMIDHVIVCVPMCEAFILKFVTLLIFG